MSWSFGDVRINCKLDDSAGGYRARCRFAILHAPITRGVHMNAKPRRRLLGILLALAMAVGLMSAMAATAYADDSASYRITVQGAANGKVTAKRLRQYVPKLFRDQVMLTALRYVARQKALRDLQITYEDCDGGCMVCLRCSDQGREMFFLRIRAANRSDAEMLGERILRNPAGFFGKVLDLAFRNEEEQFDLTDN